MENFQSTKDFKFSGVELTPVNGSDPLNITGLVSKVTYVESIYMPFVSATMVIVDSVGVLQGLPIQGMEKVKFSVKTNIREEEFEYNFRIWKVANRYAQQNKQVYTLALVSEEAIVNETIRVNQRLQGNPESIVLKLLQEELYISTTKPINSEGSLFEVSYLPTRERPFDIIAKLIHKCVSPKAKWNTDNTSEPDKVEITSSTDKKAKEIRGSGGFLFWENYRGYNFFAVDSMCADVGSDLESDKYNVQEWGPYVERGVNASDDGDNRFTIESSIFSSDLDLMNGLRRGQYGSRIVFFNHSTGEYDEYDYVLEKTYDNMAHLGGQKSLNTLTSTQKNLSKTPSKLMSIVLDHETWYNDPGIANPEDEKAENPSAFSDRQKFYAAQSTARYRLLALQQCQIVVPGNALICAGDRIDIRLINKAPSSELVESVDQEDKESSGLYLIAEATHSYDKTQSTNGAFTTTLKLTRDSYGMKDEVSNHGNK
tara:strand:+ start:463 stop:1914 length:1452 start_codon:yes stop_codon:yes gene_type:complete